MMIKLLIISLFDNIIIILTLNTCVLEKSEFHYSTNSEIIKMHLNDFWTIGGRSDVKKNNIWQKKLKKILFYFNKIN